MGDASGSGGRQRRAAIDKEVDKAVGSSKSSSYHPSASSSEKARSNATTSMNYKPSDEERRTRTYGTPPSKTLSPAAQKERDAERRKKLGK